MLMMLYCIGDRFVWWSYWVVSGVVGVTVLAYVTICGIFMLARSDWERCGISAITTL